VGPAELGLAGLASDGLADEHDASIVAEGAVELLEEGRLRFDGDDLRPGAQEQHRAIPDVRAHVERQLPRPEELAVEIDAPAVASCRADSIAKTGEVHDGPSCQQIPQSRRLSSAVVVLRRVRQAAWRLELERDAALARVRPLDLAVFHEFAPSPAGGGNQTLRAVISEFERRGLRVGVNTVSPSTRAILFNSFNFDLARLELLARRLDGARMVHRVGAVTSLYRGFDDGTDARVAETNARLADATLAISHATIEMYRRIGIELVDPHVVYNGCDSRIFNPDGRTPFGRDRKTRLISASWSDNPRKGGPTYEWLEDHLDWDRYEFTFVGNTQASFRRVRHIPPVPSQELAALLRSHDIFVTATEHDAYSNALVEALSCGLPAVYLDSGGSSEAVKDAGFGFRDREELPGLLERLVDEYEARQAQIDLPSVDQIADQYLAVLGLDDVVGVRAG
jgi:glycosyltransferase involved in cell wall biosynthesis